MRSLLASLLIFLAMLLSVAPAADGHHKARHGGTTVVAPPPPTLSVPEGSYYVSPIGSDSNPGTLAAPWRTAAHAANVVSSGSVTLLAGTYAEDVVLTRPGLTFQGVTGAVVRSFTIKASSTSLVGLSVSGASGHCVTVGAGLSGVVIDRSAISRCGRDGIRFVRPATSSSYSNDVKITNNTIANVGLTDNYGNAATIYGNNVLLGGNDITNAANDAINLWGDRITLRGNTVHDISNTTGRHNDFFQTWTGLNDGAEGLPVTNLVIEQNVVRNISGPNAHCGIGEGPGHRDWTIRNNVFMNIGDQCLILGKDGNGTQGITNILIYNNTFVSAGAANTMEFNLASSGKLVNNIFYNCVGWGGSVPYYKASTAVLTADYNLAGGTTRSLSEAHGLNGDPRLTSDFRLLAGSPAINAGDGGAVISPQRALDLYTSPTQGIVDIGATEHQG